MSKSYNIRWTDADNKELRRVVKNFNAKISRLEKKNPELKNALPERASVKAIKELVSTRNDLKRELNSLQRFSKKGSETIVVAPGNEYNTKITKWQRTEMNRRAAVINRKREKRRNDLFNKELTSRGEPLGYTAGQLGMGKIASNELKPIKAFTPSMSKADLKKKFETLVKESQDNYWMKKELQLKESYMKTLLQNFSPEDVEEVAKRIEEMEFDEFYETFLEEGGTLEDIYPPPKGTPEYEAWVTQINSVWNPQRKGT